MLPVQQPADARLVAHSCPGLGSFVGVDVFVVGTVPMVMGMELHAWRKTLVPLAAGNSLDAGRKVVMETSFVVDIAPMEGAMAGIARSGSQAFSAEKRHRPETQTRGTCCTRSNCFSKSKSSRNTFSGLFSTMQPLLKQ